jgi:hypothetical protein
MKEKEKKIKSVLECDCEYTTQDKVVKALLKERDEWAGYVQDAVDYKNQNGPIWMDWANGHKLMQAADMDIESRKRTLSEKELAVGDAQLVLNKIWDHAQYAFREYWKIQRGSIDLITEKHRLEEKLKEAVERVKEDHTAAQDIIKYSARIERIERETIQALAHLEAEHSRLIGISVRDRHEPTDEELEQWERERLKAKQLHVTAHGRPRTAIPMHARGVGT